MDKAKEMMQLAPSFVKDTADSEEHALPSAHVFPALSTRCSKSEPHCFCGSQAIALRMAGLKIGISTPFVYLRAWTT